MTELTVQDIQRQWGLLFILVARYEMQGMRPCYFAVDEETFTLYGTGWNGEPEDHLLMYKLEGLK